MKVQKIKALTVALLCVAAAGAASFNAFARPATGYETTYYTDASKTDYAGSRELLCSGRMLSDGVVTAYSDTISYRCN